jgi:two-component system, NarL family, response regulator LiaR
MIKIVIVENEVLLREVLADLLHQTVGVDCVGAFASGESALQNLPALQPDIVFMDIDLGAYCMNGIECIAQAKPLCAQTKFLVFTIFEDHQHVFDALAAGALGYILKSSPPDKIIAAIQDVMDGGSPITPSIARKLVERFSSPLAQASTETIALLSKREREIIELIAKGHTEREVADALFISFKTVKTHITNIYQKLHVNTRVDALNKYFGR